MTRTVSDWLGDARMHGHWLLLSWPEAGRTAYRDLSGVEMPDRWVEWSEEMQTASLVDTDVAEQFVLVAIQKDDASIQLVDFPPFDVPDPRGDGDVET